MNKVLASVRSGEFARALRTEAQTGYPQLEKARKTARSQAIEKVYRRLRDV
jgi:ketol-acid reductoisomerase